MYGGGIYLQIRTTQYVISGNSSFTGNIAEGDAGAIYIPYNGLENLQIDSNVVFQNNKAQKGYLIAPADIPTHDSKILTKSFTSPFEYGYNNYDIFYTQGITPFEEEEGNVQFPCIYLDQVGEYHYKIRETSVSENGWKTDQREYPVTVNITDDGNGNLISEIEYPEGFPEFENIYKPDAVCVSLRANKTAVGAPLLDGQFTFGVFDENGNQVASATNTVSGEVSS